MKKTVFVLSLAVALLLGLVLGLMGSATLSRDSFEAAPAALRLIPPGAEPMGGAAMDESLAMEEAPAKSAPGGRKEAKKMLRRMDKDGFAQNMPKGEVAAAPAAPSVMAEPAEADGEGGRGGEASGGAAAPTRAWFPETFLFEPLVVTDAAGRATVPVKVPDRLTSWRVLALAHAREGAQAGAVTSFLGTLPTYVDPVLPGALVAGDEVRLPVQVVNTTDQDVSTQLKLEARGALLTGGSGPLRVPAFGSAVQYATLKTAAAGPIGLRAVLGNTDAVEHTLDVLPAGVPRSESRGGTLATTRTFEVDGPADPLPGSERVRLQVYPGALALLRNELSVMLGRGSAADDAYALHLAGRADALLRALGAPVDKAALRDLQVVAAQRAYRHARGADVAVAAAFAEAALAHPENPVLQRLGERLAGQVALAQRPDGTCQGADGWTLQRLMVTTADCVRAARAASGTPAGRQRAVQVAVRAAGAFERNLERIDDAYTAAAVLASSAVEGAVADRLRERVKEGVKPDGNGGAYVPVEPGTQRADGREPSELEATALAVLALKDVKGAPVAELGAHVLGGYTPWYGWGDGPTNQAALLAVLELFSQKPPGQVKVVLSRDGTPVSETTLGADKLMEVATLEVDAKGSAGRHVWTVAAEPPVPGLGFSLTVSAYVPWKDEGAQGGLELAIEVPKALRVGQASALGLTASAPAGEPLAVRLSLPAGVQPDAPSLDALVQAGTVQRYEREDGAVTLHLRALDSGGVFQGQVKVVPTLAGTLHAAPSKLTPTLRPQLARAFAPATWAVAP